ncbi:MAG: ABC transporter permease [Candidatus Bathyarchaeia archaeon]
MSLSRGFLAAYVMWLRELKRFWRSRSRVFATVVQPLLWFALFGVGFGSSFRFVGMSMEYIVFLAPGVVAISVFFSSLFGGISVIWDRRFGFLKEIMVAPVSRTSIILGRTAGVATTSAIQGLLVLTIAFLVFPGFLNLSGLPLSIVTMTLIALIFSGMGLAIGSRMKSPEGFHLIQSFLSLPLFILSGAFFPLVNLPTWMKALSYIDPLTYGVDALRITLVGFGNFSIWVDYSLMITISIAMILFGAYVFTKTSLE